MASVVPLCRLCGKKALCTFLKPKISGFSLRNVHSAFFPQRHHRGHRGQRGENVMPFSERSQRHKFFFADGPLYTPGGLRASTHPPAGFGSFQNCNLFPEILVATPLLLKDLATPNHTFLLR